MSISAKWLCRVRSATALAAAILILGNVVSASGQSKLTENTLKFEGQSPVAKIDVISWLSGSWAGEAMGRVSEEIWSEPSYGTMLGSYKLSAKGQPIFYELLTIREIEGTLLLQLKHFNADLTGWEEKNETVDFPLVKVETDAVHFEGMSFHKESDDKVKIYLAMTQEDGSYQEATFYYTRKQ